MTQAETIPATLSPEEIAAAIEAMPSAGWVKLHNIARAYCRKRPHEAADLLQEAFTRALAGTRHCPRDVDMVYFMSEAMRSIASDKAKSRRRKPELKFGELAPVLDEDEELEFDPPDKGPTAEDQLSSFEEVKKIKGAILGLFADDEIAQIISEGMMDNIDGEELRSLTGLDNTAFNSKRRLVRRRIEKAFPKGWTL